MLSLLQVTGEALDSPPISVASLEVKDERFVLGLVKMWITSSHTASVCHLCHMQLDAQTLSSVQRLPPVCPICPTQSMAKALPLAPHFLCFALSCSVTNVTRSQPSASFLCISPWDEKQLLPSRAQDTWPYSQPAYTHPSSLFPAPSLKSYICSGTWKSSVICYNDSEEINSSIKAAS